MKRNFFLLAVFLGTAFPSFAKDKDWKGAPYPNQFTGGAMMGLGIRDSSAGFSMLGTIAAKIVPQGFIPDINNDVFLEAAGGP